MRWLNHSRGQDDTTGMFSQPATSGSRSRPMSRPRNAVSKYSGAWLSCANVESTWEISRCICYPHGAITGPGFFKLKGPVSQVKGSGHLLSVEGHVTLV